MSLVTSAATMHGRFPFAPSLGACLKTPRGAATRSFDSGQGGEAGASPQRAVTAEPTPARVKRTVARRVVGEKRVWLRCSSLKDPQGIWTSQSPARWFPRVGCALSRKAVSLLAPRHAPVSPTTAPLGVFKQALRSVEKETASDSNFSPAWDPIPRLRCETPDFRKNLLASSVGSMRPVCGRILEAIPS